MARQSPQRAPDEVFFNRELSWLEFNRRVLGEARSAGVPWLERLKFFCIAHSNLDEFFEVRVAGLRQEKESGRGGRSPDGRTAGETLEAVAASVRALLREARDGWRDELVPGLARAGIRFLHPAALGDAARSWLAAYYRERVHPVLTPLAVDPSHPFPQVLNKSENLITRATSRVGGELRRRLVIVQVPRVLPAVVELPSAEGRMDFVFLADVIGAHLGELFPGTELEAPSAFRVTRNGELYIDEEETGSLLDAVEAELDNRRKGEAVRLEVSASCPVEIQEELLGRLGLDPKDPYVTEGPLNPARLMSVCAGEHSPALREPAFVAREAEGLGGREDLFAAIRERDRLLHHPYESFETVVRFLEQAASDPRVLAIKQTLYRTGGDPRVVGALMSAVRNGKQVTAVVELKARFDEANNIRWARALEEAGVHVVYGVVGYKIHCKAALVVRREDEGIRRYVHLSTGNYNASTARTYTDLGLLTARAEFGEDVSDLFNLLTGLCRFQGTRRLLVAPYQMAERLVEMMDREAAHARAGMPARIVAKMNSLVDPDVIEALYRASRAGVEVDLIVRGICCLRPGVEGMSATIRVRSIVDRFLEHGRVWSFANGGRPEVWMASADWMPRNLHKRIEAAFPVEDGRLRERVEEEILGRQLLDTAKARLLQPDGRYLPAARRPGTPARRSQLEFMELATRRETVQGKARHPPRMTPGRRPAPST
ncbi:MAG: polyphosphate kinase 1 [Verrucomicrobiota bacterium]